MKNYPTNEQRTTEYLKKFDRESTLKFVIRDSAPVILDVGANTGDSMVQFKTWWPDAEVHCFEPQEECLIQLKARAREFQRVQVNEFAAGSVPSKDQLFFTHAVSSGLSGFNKVNLQSTDSIDMRKLRDSEDTSGFAAYRSSVNQPRKVEIRRLDDYVNAKGLKKITLLKMDTQGYEPEVLQGTGERLKDVAVVISELMFYDYYERSLSFSDIEKYLAPAGFRLYDISHISKNPMNGRTDWVDVIYVNKNL